MAAARFPQLLSRPPRFGQEILFTAQRLSIYLCTYYLPKPFQLEDSALPMQPRREILDPAEPQLVRGQPRHAGGTPADLDLPLGWHARGYHPHCDYPGLVQSIGFRLFDSVPIKVVERWQAELEREGNKRRRQILLERIDRYADSGYGGCMLADPRIAQLVEDALLHFDEQRYDLLAWCVMSNHVHVLAVPKRGHPLSGIAHSWKSYTSHQANRILNRSGDFWFPDYFDEFMKSTAQLEATIVYIEMNPVAVGLVARPEEWPCSSANPKHRQRVLRNRSRYPEIGPETLPDW